MLCSQLWLVRFSSHFHRRLMRLQLFLSLSKLILSYSHVTKHTRVASAGSAVSNKMGQVLKVLRPFDADCPPADPLLLSSYHFSIAFDSFRHCIACENILFIAPCLESVTPYNFKTTASPY